MIQTSEIDPRISAHLLPGEQVLWQGAPRKDTFFGPPQFAVFGGLVAVGVALAAGLLDGAFPALAGSSDAMRYLPALAAIVDAALIAQRDWMRRGPLWSYAITDRRLLSILGGRVVRSLTPAELDQTRLEIEGDTVYWARSPRKSDDHSVPDGFRRGPDHPLIGFHGQDDPNALRQRIRAWRAGLTASKVAQTQAFLTEAPEPVPMPAEAATPADAPETEPGWYLHGETGVSLRVPEGWEVTVCQRTAKKVPLLGTVMNESEPQPYSGPAGWNLLRAQGAPDALFNLYLRPGGIEKTLQEIVGDRWSGLAGLRLLDQEPDLVLPGGYRGFALRRLGPGAQAASSEEAPETVLHQAWLTNGQFALEVQASSPLDHPVYDAAITKMLHGIRA